MYYCTPPRLLDLLWCSHHCHDAPSILCPPANNIMHQLPLSPLLYYSTTKLYAHVLATSKQRLFAKSPWFRHLKILRKGYRSLGAQSCQQLDSPIPGKPLVHLSVRKASNRQFNIHPFSYETPNGNSQPPSFASLCHVRAPLCQTE